MFCICNFISFLGAMFSEYLCFATIFDRFGMRDQNKTKTILIQMYRMHFDALYYAYIGSFKGSVHEN